MAESGSHDVTSGAQLQDLQGSQEVTTLVTGDVQVSSQGYTLNTVRILYICIGVIGCLGNLMVVLIMGTSKSMRKTTTNRFMIHQSITDGLVALSLILTSTFDDTGRKYSGIADEIYCRLWLTKVFLWGTLVTSTYNLVAMTIERYLSIVHPIVHKNHWSTKVFIACIIIVWVLGFGYNLAYMIPSSYITPEGVCSLYSLWPNEATRKGQGIFTIVFQFFIPLMILVVCYGRMAKMLQSKIQPDDNAKKSTNNMARARNNVIKTLVLVGVSFFLCWIWNQIFFLLFNLGHPTNFDSTFYHFTVLAVFFNCCINPFIYVLKYEQFQRKILRVFRLCYNKGTFVQSEMSNTQSATNQ